MSNKASVRDSSFLVRSVVESVRIDGENCGGNCCYRLERWCLVFQEETTIKDSKQLRCASCNIAFKEK